VEKTFKRVENIDEKIMSVKLPYNAWKVLFLVDEDVDAGKMVELLGEEQAAIEKALERLLAENLIETVKASSAEIEPETPQDVSQEETEVVEEIKEEQTTETEETDEAEESVEELLPEPEEAEGEKEPLETEPEKIEELLMEQAAEESAEETSIEEMLQEKDTGELSETLEDVFSEKETDQDVEIKLPAEEELPSETLTVSEEPPVKAETSAEPEAPAEAEIQEESDKTTILIVDDSIVIRKMVEIALEDEDYILKTAISGRDGLDKLDSVKPDLVILDLMLPDINGIDILKAVKKSSHIPVIMLSGKDSPQMVESAKEAGADAFLPKPFKDEDLKEKIKALIES